MKSKSTEIIAKAKELLTAIKTRRELEKKEMELKEFFKSKRTDNYIDADGILISFSDKKRTSLDRKALEAKFGKDVIAQFETTTEYTQIDVKESA